MEALLDTLVGNEEEGEEEGRMSEVDQSEEEALGLSQNLRCLRYMLHLVR